MKLDRNINNDGKGKYALVRLRGIDQGSEAHSLLMRLRELGHVDLGIVGEPDEFFVIKLRDRYADAATRGYSNAVMKQAGKTEDSVASMDLAEYALQVQKLETRAGVLSPFCKDPD